MVQTGFELPERVGRLIGPGRLTLEVLLLVVLAALSARMVWMMVAPQDSVARLIERPLPAPVADAGSALEADRTRLVQLNPFGTQVVEAVDVATEAPETTLNLRLIGLFMSTGSELSSAQIVTPDNRAQRFRVGDEILPGVTIERILSDRVILRRNGENEALLRDGRSETLAVISDGSQVTTILPNEDAEAETGRGTANETTGVIADPAAFLSSLALSPVERDGTLYAFEINSPSTATLTEAGLRSGDLLRMVNGRSAAQLTQGDIIDAVQENEQISLIIERAGAELRLRLEIGG